MADAAEAATATTALVITDIAVTAIPAVTAAAEVIASAVRATAFQATAFQAAAFQAAAVITTSAAGIITADTADMVMADTVVIRRAAIEVAQGRTFRCRATASVTSVSRFDKLMAGGRSSIRCRIRRLPFLLRGNVDTVQCLRGCQLSNERIFCLINLITIDSYSDHSTTGT